MTPFARVSTDVRMVGRSTGAELKQRFVILQIMPAAPNTYAIYKGEDGVAVWRLPVPAWGRWEEFGPNGRVKRRAAGPLVVDDLELVPAFSINETSPEGELLGLRMGHDLESIYAWGHDEHPVTGDPSEEFFVDPEGWSKRQRERAKGTADGLRARIASLESALRDVLDANTPQVDEEHFECSRCGQLGTHREHGEESRCPIGRALRVLGEK